MKKATNNTVQQLRQSVDVINRKLATFSVNARSKRDIGIAKAFLSLVKNLRSSALLAQRTSTPEAA